MADEPESAADLPPSPRVTIRGLLFFTACLCVSLPATAGGADLGDVDWANLALALGTFGVATELAMQAVAVQRSPGFAAAAGVRWLAVGGLATCLLAWFAEAHGWTTRPDGNDALLGATLFPELLWHALLVLSAATLAVRPARRASLLSRVLVATLVTLFLTLYAAAVAGELGVIPLLVHLATSGIEAAHAGRWHRPGAFPSHLAEGFFTFRVGTGAVVALSAAALALVGSVRPSDPRARRVGLATFALLWCGLAAVCWWYYRYEYTRVSPDLASSPLAATRWDLAGGLALTACLAGYLACRLAASSDPPPGASNRGALGAIPLWMAALGLTIGGGVPAALTAAMVFADFPLPDGLRMLFLSPTVLLYPTLGLAGLQLLPVAWKMRPAPIRRINPGRAATGFVLLSMLALVAAPTLAAYSLAYWLGPWWK